MMSVAGGWFFLMACEAFVLNNRDLRLPGLGSYLQTAPTRAICAPSLWGLAAMIAVIVLMDQLIWRPHHRLGEKFKFEQVEAAQTPRSPVLDWLRRSQLLSRAAAKQWTPAREALDSAFRAAVEDSAEKIFGAEWLSGSARDSGNGR
jgi:NitT/TauT family transport system permease protein